MKQVLSKGGQIVVDELPPPMVDDQGVLVAVAYSAISIGTESTVADSSAGAPPQKAVRDQNNAIKVFRSLRKRGVRGTVARIRGALDQNAAGAGAGSALGYSCAGVAIQVGSRVKGIVPGDRVACAGQGKANHAEMVLAPRNLVVRVPEECKLRDAASVAIGAIALQGVRRADVRLGETVGVIGLGLVGQLTSQVLRASGCHVYGIDVDESRIEHAKSLGMPWGGAASSPDLLKEILAVTDGYGVDATIVTASAPERDEIVAQAMNITRRKGKVVVVGDVGLGINRADMYQKELDFLMSTSYGPGRYDANYEEKGLDYPLAWVRWTEQRNMSAYLELLAEEKVSFESLRPQVYPVEQAAEAYQSIRREPKPLAVVLDYNLEERGASKSDAHAAVMEVSRPSTTQGALNAALIGAGGYAKGTVLPNLRELSSLYSLAAVASSTGANARDTAQQFGAAYCTTDYRDVLADDKIDVVFITTRHAQHAEMAMAAARAGKAVFLEKPMALNDSELDELTSTVRETGAPFMVGFNRRFSPAAQRLRDAVTGAESPLMVLYRLNGGNVPQDHWVQTEEGGGRLIGEACHMLDFFSFLTGDAAIDGVDGLAITPHSDDTGRTDNFTGTVRYANGSTCTLLYTALGNDALPKEYVEVHFDGKSAVLDDFTRLSFHGHDGPGWRAPDPDKGQRQILETFARVVKGEIENPLPLDSMEQTTRASFILDRLVRET